MTLNKDGTPRKAGSGRKKGATSLVSVKLSELRKRFNDDDVIVCGRIFLEKAGIQVLAPAIHEPLSEDIRDSITLTKF